jgi:hypothetical protein
MKEFLYNELQIQYDGTLDLIFMDELMALLNYESEKSAKDWCRRNQVEIYGRGHRKHIMRYDYDKAIKIPQIKLFREKYGDKWEYAFELAQANQLYKLELEYEPVSIHCGDRYKPKSVAASKIK